MRRLLISPFRDPYLNLAIESRFLDNLREGEEILFLYINDPAVVIGRFQNPWAECRPSRMKDCALVRRESGGGTVYHDSGNLNFSFIQNSDDYDKTANLQRVISILTPWDLPLGINDRHDLILRLKEGEYKVSGSAFRHKKDRAFHHGTLLIDCKTDRLRASITPGEERVFLKSSGTASKRSPVKNLNELREDMTMEGVLDSFRAWYAALSDGRVDEPDGTQWSDLAADAAERRAMLISREWILGKTPAFVQDISALSPPESEGWSIKAAKGILTETPEALTMLKGLAYGSEELMKRIAEMLTESPKLLSSLSGFSDLSGDELLSRFRSLIG